VQVRRGGSCSVEAICCLALVRGEIEEKDEKKMNLNVFWSQVGTAPAGRVDTIGGSHELRE
jgi:hypothetical protein